MNSQAPSAATGTETGIETDTDPDGGSEPTDADLVAAVRAGDTGAHGTLYTCHESGARRLAYTLVHDSADADDCDRSTCATSAPPPGRVSAAARAACVRPVASQVCQPPRPAKAGPPRRPGRA
jgi:hypothetical protein